MQTTSWQKGTLRFLENYNPSDPEEISFRLILRKIEKGSTLDFTSYKDKCLKRRIRVRLRSLEIDSFTEYFELLQNNEKELKELIDTITINVTQFFRDLTTFQFLMENIMQVMCEDKARETLRIWSAACASEEEVYTIAIAIMEVFGRRLEKLKVDLIGTDIDDKSLELANAGVYPSKNLRVLAENYPSYLEKYFVPSGKDNFKIKDSVRRIVQFKKRDVIKDPHYLNMDIIFCRNLFIYFEKSLQERILNRFHEDLLPNGYLVLGKVETILGMGEKLFKSISVKERVYQKI